MTKARTPTQNFFLRENRLSPKTAKTPSQSQHLANLEEWWQERGEVSEHTSSLPNVLRWTQVSRGHGAAIPNSGVFEKWPVEINRDRLMPIMDRLEKQAVMMGKLERLDKWMTSLPSHFQGTMPSPPQEEIASLSSVKTEWETGQTQRYHAREREMLEWNRTTRFVY